MLPDFLADEDRLRAMADAGRERALNRFSPRRLAETMLSMIAATPALVATRDHEE
jgi:hypothetical protein